MAGTIVFDSAQPDGHSFRVLSNTGTTLLTANGTQIVANTSLTFRGATSGSITIAAPAVAGSNTLTLPVASDTLVGVAATQTLTNKTLTSPTISGGGVIGVGQTWTNNTSTRSAGTTYTNSTGVPIMVLVTVQQAASYIVDYSVVVSGSTLTRVYAATSGQQTTAYLPTTFIVPPSATYSVTVTTGTIATWYELR